jgi:hypothetical protein
MFNISVESKSDHTCLESKSDHTCLESKSDHTCLESKSDHMFNISNVNGGVFNVYMKQPFPLLPRY